MERITCPKCGEQVFASEPFCPACGTVLGKEEDEQAAPPPRVLFETPVAYELSGPLLDSLAEAMQEGERVLVSLQNESGTVALAATNRRVLVLRTGALTGTYGRTSCRELPYLSIAEVKHQTVGALGKLQLMVRTIAGKPEVGVRGRMAKLTPENLAGMPTDKLVAVAGALRKLVAKAEALQKSAE